MLPRWVRSTKLLLTVSKIMIRYKDKKCTQFADSLRHQQLVEHYKTGCDIETNIMYTYQKK